MNFLKLVNKVIIINIILLLLLLLLLSLLSLLSLLLHADLDKCIFIHTYDCTIQLFQRRFSSGLVHTKPEKKYAPEYIS